MTGASGESTWSVPTVAAGAVTALPYSCADDSSMPRSTRSRGDQRPVPVLEEPNCPPLVVDVDVVRCGGLAVARHRLHVAAERDEPAGAGVGANVPHGDREACRRVRERGIVREREVRLRHADRELVEADALELLDLLARGRLEQDPVAA